MSGVFRNIDPITHSPPGECVPPLLWCGGRTTEYTELQPLLSGVHSVMRVKLVLAGESGGAHPPPFTTITITSKVAVHAPAEWADTLTLFHLYQYMYSVGRTHSLEGEGVRGSIVRKTPDTAQYTIYVSTLWGSVLEEVNLFACV
jgi:hypothetical protein